MRRDFHSVLVHRHGGHFLHGSHFLNPPSLPVTPASPLLHGHDLMPTDMGIDYSSWQMKHDRTRILRNQINRSFRLLSLSPNYVKVESYLRKQFASKKSEVYPSDIANTLGLDYETVREIIAKMMEEHKLEPASG